MQFFTSQETIKQDLELINLPPVDLLFFDGNRFHWLEVIEKLYHRIHKKSVFNDSPRIEHLMNSLHGKA